MKPITSIKSSLSRRDFLKSTAAFMVWGAATQAPAASQIPGSSIAKRPLGKTGELVSAVGFGAGSRFCSIQDEDAAQALLERAWDAGINYFDTSASYTRKGLERLSERRLGEFSRPRRKGVFLATKFDPRDRDGALRSVERSLKLLQTDYLDLIQIHSLRDHADLKRMDGPNGAVAAVLELKNQRVARFVGITGHNDGGAMTEALRRYDFDVVLMSLNAAQSANPVAARRMEPIPAFETAALPLALQKQMGIVSMKVMGQGMLVGKGAGRASAPELLQFNLSQPVACVVIGVEQKERLEENIQAARAFVPMTEREKQNLQQRLTPSRGTWYRFLKSHDDSLPV
ncbi:MAG: aldo/keto reductase [Deltaproteobacteria bacterium]|nr:aldo/keto reductase [Deltaproteobacteria bacterium]